MGSTRSGLLWGPIGVTLVLAIVFAVPLWSDGGDSWMQINDGIGYPGISCLAVHPEDPLTVYAGQGPVPVVGREVYKTTDGGLNWFPTSPGLTRDPRRIVIDPTSPEAVYVATEGEGMFRTTDGGGTWVSCNEGIYDTRLYSLLIDPQTPNNLYAGSMRTLYKTTDCGNTWFDSPSGMDIADVAALATDLPDFFALGVCALIFRSTNAGVTWTIMDYTGVHGADIVVNPSEDPLWVYAGINENTEWLNRGTVMRSTDGGISWEKVFSASPPPQHLEPPQITCLAVNPVFPTTLYAGLSGELWGWPTPYHEIVKTTDGGDSWFEVGGISPNILSLAIDPEHPETVYLGETYYGVRKSTDGGTSWEIMNVGLPSPPCRVKALTIDRVKTAVVYAGTPAGVFKTTNGGDNWVSASAGIGHPETVSLVTDPEEPSIVYAATKDNLDHGDAYLTVDGAFQWIDMTGGLPDTLVNDLAIDVSYPDTTYAATAEGVYYYVPPWEHKPLTSSSPYATAYNGGRNLSRVANTDELWVAYQSGGGAFVTHSPDGGEHWQPKTFLGIGGFPTIAVSVPSEQGPSPLPFPVVVWSAPEPNPAQLSCARLWAGQWQFATLHANPNERQHLPSIVIDPDNRAHVAWERVDVSSNVRYLSYGVFQVDGPWPPTFASELNVDNRFGVDWFMAPGIDVDYMSAPVSIPTHIVYKKDDGIYYVKKEAGVWSSPVMISQPDHTASFPFIDIYGEDMHALWHAHDASQPDEPEDVWYCTKTVNEPYWPYDWDNVSETPSWESQFPCMAAAFASWSEEWAFPAGNWEVGMKEEPFGDPMVNISESDELSKYPHINYWQSAPTTHNLFFLWTEGNGPIYTVPVTQVVLNHPPVPYLYVRTGQEQPSFYCVERDGFIQFGPEAYKQVDIGADQLIYRLPGLMPWMRYQLKVTGYWEGEDEIRERLDIDGLDQRLIKLEPGVPETLAVWISPAAYKDDKEVDVTISLISGEWALTGPIVLYQFEREEEGDGGSQVAATPQLRPQSFSLSQNFPNPVVHSTAIDYQLPVSGFASLRIYDTSGRLVRTLVDEPTEMGYHRARWNGVDDAGRPVANGIYFYRLEAGSFTHTNKMVVLK